MSRNRSKSKPEVEGAVEKVDSRRIYANIHERNEAQKARRRARYKSDSKYREYMKRHSSANYRKRTGVVIEPMAIEVSKISSVGSKRLIVDCYDKTKINKHITTFTMNESSTCIGVDPQSLYRWVHAELIPSPATTAINVISTKPKPNSKNSDEVLKNMSVSVFTLPEIKSIHKHLSKHQKDTTYFKKSDINVINNIKTDIELIRDN